MQLTLNINNVDYSYYVYFPDVPSVGNCFDKMQYSEPEWRAKDMSKYVDKIKEATNLRLHPNDRDARITINGCTYELPNIAASKKGFWYIDTFSIEYSKSACNKLNDQLKPQVDKFIAEHYDTIKQEAFDKFRSDFHERSAKIIASCHAMDKALEKLLS